MKKVLLLVLAVTLFLGLALTGCGTKKAESGKEAIAAAKAMETNEEKVNYLIAQAKAFYNSKEFQDAVDITQYILRYVDRNSQVAKDLLQKAKDALAAQAKAAVEDAKKGLAR